MSDLSWTNVTVKLSDLIPWTNNPKTSTGKNAQQLQTSHDELGQFQTVAIEPTDKPNVYQVADGHQRLSAWLAKYGKAAEIDARLASRPLTETERRKIAIYSRQIGAWDWDVLSGWEPDELAGWGFDVDLLGEWGRDYAALVSFLDSENEPELNEGKGEYDENIQLIGKQRKRWSFRHDNGFLSVRSFETGKKKEEIEILKSWKAEKPEYIIDAIAIELSSLLVATFGDLSMFTITTAPVHKTGFSSVLANALAVKLSATYEELFFTDIDNSATRVIFGERPRITIKKNHPTAVIFIDDTLTTGQTLKACRDLHGGTFLAIIWIYDDAV